YTAKVTLSKNAFKSMETSDETIVTADDFESLSIFPNPTSGKINLDYTAASDGKIEVKILNLTGTSVMETTFNAMDGSNNFSMDLTGQPAGIYILELTSDHDRILKKVMVRK
ncbi:MAG: T9SS type A sorting domain-containing protein, partial [Bacteroidota bacterium]